MQQLILLFHVIISIAMVGLILVQQGKGSDVGAAFGSGSSNTMFGSQGATPFLFKLTATLAALFFACCLVLSNMAASVSFNQVCRHCQPNRRRLQRHRGSRACR